MKLLVYQKNHVFDIIEKCGLNPIQFDLTESKIDGKVESQIKVKNHDYYFKFKDYNDPNYYIAYCPQKEIFNEVSRVVQNWGDVINSLSYWIGIIQLELNNPDKWKQFYYETSKLKIVNNESNNPFTAFEYDELREKIEILKNKIASLNLLPEQVDAINKKLSHLELLAKTLSKHDWNDIFIGAMVGLILHLTLPPELNQMIWRFIQETFSTLLLN
jgi:hypothetical protein